MVLRSSVVFDPPAWHAVALCRGDGPEAWMVTRGANTRTEELRSICRRCPGAVDCLIAALDEDFQQRGFGPMRCSVSGHRPWKMVHALVDELAPVSRSDWESVTSMILDEGILTQLRRLARVA